MTLQRILSELHTNVWYRINMFQALQPFIESRNNLQHAIKLGRWNYKVTKEQLHRKIDLANSDNCACAYPQHYKAK